MFATPVMYMLLIILLLPITRAVVGRGTGDWYTMLIPLFVASFPFVARMVEQSLAEVPSGEVEAIRSMETADKAWASCDRKGVHIFEF